MAGTENLGRATNISESAPFVELHQSLASRVGAISPLVDRLMRFIRLFMRRFGISQATEDEIETAISEVVANAVIHGNHENTKKSVDVIYLSSPFTLIDVSSIR